MEMPTDEQFTPRVWYYFVSSCRSLCQVAPRRGSRGLSVNHSQWSAHGDDIEAQTVVTADMSSLYLKNKMHSSRRLRCR